MRPIKNNTEEKEQWLDCLFYKRIFLFDQRVKIIKTVFF